MLCSLPKEPDVPSDLTDQQWKLVRGHLRRPDPRGAREAHAPRVIVNAILYVLRTGCQWRLLPNDFPPWPTVYGRYRRWCLRGCWERALDALNASSRRKAGRAGSPSCAIVDSQSVRTACASHERGIDGGKKVKGRKRHISTDTPGNLPRVSVHAANIHDTTAGPAVFRATLDKHPSIEAFSANEG